jgi:3-(3-hydroxy-phenyl)propionate hydroxylase
MIYVVGAGPVGLSVAVALAREGIDVEVLESQPSLSDEARASTLHPPTLELFARWGIADQVIAAGRRVDKLQFWDRRDRRLIAELDYGLLSGETPYPFRLQCPQSTVTRLLHARLGDRVRFGQVVTEVTPEGDVFVGKKRLHGEYVVGADGSKSVVRSSLGLGFEGATYPDRFLLVTTDLDLKRFFPGLGPVAYVFDPDEWVIFMELPGMTRVVFRVDDEATDEATVRRRFAGLLGQEVDFAIKGAWTYSVHRRVTERFRVGRVLLAGDAAHINNPAGGMGMNSGIHDADHLAHALVRAMRGDDSLLDVYAEARRRVAVEAVQAVSDRNYRDLVARGRAEREERDKELARAAKDEHAARAYLRRASMMDVR